MIAARGTRWGVWCGVWLALGVSCALAQSPSDGLFPVPYEAAPLPEELNIVDGLPDEPPAPPSQFSSASLTPGGVTPFDEGELAPTPTLSSGSWLRNGLSYVEADVVLLQHNGFNKIKLAIDNTTNSKRRLNVERGALGLATNMRITMGQYLQRDAMNRDHAVEFTFYGLGNWDGAGSVTAATANFLTSQLDQFVGGYNGSNEQTYRYNSDFDSYEVNYRLSWRLGRDQMVLQPGGDWVRQATPGTLFSVLAGLRVVQVDERFNYTSVSTVPNLRRGSLFIQTSNDLVGGQLGGQFMQQFSNFNWGVRGKMGTYVNFTSMTSDIETVDPVFLELDRQDRAEADILAFVGEMSVFGNYHIRPNFCFHAAFEAMWMTQIAVAPEQINLTDNPVREVETGGSPSYMGFSTGFEVTW